MAHVLENNPKWVFWQPYMQVKSEIILDDASGVLRKKNVLAESTCREGLISNVRSSLWNLVMKETAKKGRPFYDKKCVRSGRISLYDPSLLDSLEGANQLRIHMNGLKFAGLKVNLEKTDQEIADEFLKVADAVVGIPSVLLSHNRPTGDWWESSKPKPKDDYIKWSGSDNWFMRHPALLSIATGLLRQAALLVSSGFGSRVLETVSRADIEESLTTGDWKLACEQSRKLRPWIEVPPGRNGHERHYPIPLGLWGRFESLYRAQQQHNYRKIFGSTIYLSWGLTGTSGRINNYSGSQNFWGGTDSLKEEHYKLMELGKSRRGSRRGKKATPGS